MRLSSKERRRIKIEIHDRKFRKGYPDEKAIKQFKHMPDYGKQTIN